MTTSEGQLAYAYSYADRNNASVTNTTITSSEQMSSLDVIQVPFQDDFGSYWALDHDGILVCSNLSTGKFDWLLGTEMIKTLYLTPNITDTVHTLVHHMNVALRSINTFEDFQTNLLNGKKSPKTIFHPKSEWKAVCWSIYTRSIALAMADTTCAAYDTGFHTSRSNSFAETR
jgi:hypothetical protein